MNLTISSERVVTTGGERIIPLHVKASEPITELTIRWAWDERLGTLRIHDHAAGPWTLNRQDRSGHMAAYQVKGTFDARGEVSIPLQADIPPVPPGEINTINGGFGVQLVTSTPPADNVDHSQLGAITVEPVLDLSDPNKPPKPEPEFEPRIISLPTELTVTQGQQFGTPVRIDDATGVKSVTFDVFYPGHALVPIDFRPGREFRDWAFLGNLRLEDQIRIALSITGRNPSEEGPKRLGNIIWQARADAPPGTHVLDLDHAAKGRIAGREDVEDGYHYTSKDTRLTIVASPKPVEVEPIDVPDVVGSEDELAALQDGMHLHGKRLNNLRRRVQRLERSARR